MSKHIQKRSERHREIPEGRHRERVPYCSYIIDGGKKEEMCVHILIFFFSSLPFHLILMAFSILYETESRDPIEIQPLLVKNVRFFYPSPILSPLLLLCIYPYSIATLLFIDMLFSSLKSERKSHPCLYFSISNT